MLALVARIALSTIIVPSRIGSQRLGDVSAVATLISGCTAYIVGKLCPFRIGRDMPARGANALHTARVGGTGGHTVH